MTFIAAGFRSEPEKANEFSESLLQVAADGDIDQVKSLLSQGADVNTEDEKGQTALHLAVREGHLALAELLLSKGAEVDVKDKFGWTALNCRSNLVTGPSSVSKRLGLVCCRHRPDVVGAAGGGSSRRCQVWKGKLCQPH